MIEDMFGWTTSIFHHFRHTMNLDRSFLGDGSEQSLFSPLSPIPQNDRRTISPLLSNHEARASEREHKTNPTVFELKEEAEKEKYNARWEWECASQLLSISCTAIAIAILIYMNNKPLSHWKLPIAPNSLIAIPFP